MSAATSVRRDPGIADGASARRATLALAVVAAMGTAGYVAVALNLDGPHGFAARWGAWGLGAGLTVVGSLLVRRTSARAGLLVILVGATLFRAVLVPAPVGSDDIYRFIWDGRVQAAGVNPYRYAPADDALADLRDEAIWPNINRVEARTIYPPATQATFRAAHALGLRTPQTFKILTAGADVAALLLLVALLRRNDRDPRWVVAYAWNPVPILGFAHAGHMDSLVVVVLLAAALRWHHQPAEGGDRGGARAAVAIGALLGLAASLKLFPLLLLPAFLRARDGTWRWREAMIVPAVALAVLAVTYVPYLAGSGDVLGFLPTYLEGEGFTTGRRSIPLRWLGVEHPLAAPLLGAGVAVAVLRSRRPVATRAAWLWGAAMLLSAIAYPWYAAMLLAFAVAGGAGWAWPAMAIAWEASYIALWFRPGGQRMSVPIRGVVALAMAVLAVASIRWVWARRAVLWQPPDAATAERPHPGTPVPDPTGRQTEAPGGRRLCVVMPALDEADALPAALEGRPADVDLIVVDNGSTDRTAEVARELGAKVVDEPRRGFGSACLAGARAAPAGSVLVFMDADATLSWTDLDAVVTPVRDGQADLVLGRRAPERREAGAMAWHIALANRALARLCSRVSGVPVSDISPYRAIRREVLLDLGLIDRTYGWPLEMVLRAGRADLRVLEVPVAYRRRVGTSKVTGRLWPTARATARMSRVLLRHARADGRGGAG